MSKPKYDILLIEDDREKFDGEMNYAFSLSINGLDIEKIEATSHLGTVWSSMENLLFDYPADDPVFDQYGSMTVKGTITTWKKVLKRAVERNIPGFIAQIETMCVEEEKRIHREMATLEYQKRRLEEKREKLQKLKEVV